MNTTPNCLYCGTTMKPDRTFMSMLPAGERPHFWYLCGECGSRSPAMRTQEAAKAAALQRYVEPNRVLTLECVAETLSQTLPVYLEIEGEKGGVWLGNGDQIYAELRDGWAGSHKAERSGGQWDLEYGREWRCWLRRPTDEERQSVAWEESK